jgi:hypothetical protein
MYCVDKCRIVDEGMVYISRDSYCPCRTITLQVTLEMGTPPQRAQPEEYEEFFLDSVKKVVGKEISKVDKFW